MENWDPTFYQDILDNLNAGVYYVNLERGITYWNKAAQQITGFSGTEVRGRRCSDNILKHVDHQGVCLCLESCPLAETLQDGAARTASVYVHHKEGHRLPVSIRISPIKNRSGEILGAVEVFVDDSETVGALQRLKELEGMVYLDSLTGIANRRFLEIFLTARFNEMQRHGWSFGLIYADIDHFKWVNDLYGHDAGDQVIKMVSQTLAKNCRSFDLVGRWGGDEFLCVLCHLSNPDQLRATAERLRILVENSWVPTAAAPIAVTVSMGATLARSDDSLQTLIRRADQLLYRSKSTGRNGILTE